MRKRSAISHQPRERWNERLQPPPQTRRRRMATRGWRDERAEQSLRDGRCRGVVGEENAAKAVTARRNAVRLDGRRGRFHDCAMKPRPREFELTADILLRAYSIGVFPMAESRE